MAKSVHAGLLTLDGGYFVPVEEVTLIVPASAVEDAEKADVDATFRSGPRTVVLTRSGRLIASHLDPDLVASRYEKARLALEKGRVGGQEKDGSDG